jgi:predicted lipoprotein with Yx(FWY)xxD motif
MTSTLERPTARLSLLGLIVLAAVVASLTASGDARAAKPAAEGAQARSTLTVRSTRFGRILFDGRGRALYGFTRDRRGGPSQCHGACARAWPVYFGAGKLRAGKGARQSLIGTVRRPDGRRQVTYNGWPLYYYVGDRQPGQVLCQNVEEFGGIWLVVRPSGGLVR